MLRWILFIISQTLMLPAAFGLQGPAQYAQVDKNTSQSNVVIKAKVAMVPIDTIVQNRKGQFVDKLCADDFEVYDNGVSQKIDLFGRDTKPLDVALVVDHSGSETRYVLKLRQIALDVLNKLDPQEDRVALFCFGSYPSQLTGLTLDRSLIAGSIDRMPLLGSTNIGAALWDSTQYLRMQPKERRRVIILISDNVDPGIMPVSVEVLQEMLESNIVLYSIKTPGENPGSFQNQIARVAQLAEETGGDVLTPNSVDALSSKLNAVILRLKNSYQIGFYPSAEGNDGSYHKLKINLKSNVKCSDCKVQARKSYYTGGHTDSLPEKKNRAPLSLLGPGLGFAIASLNYVTPQSLFFENGGMPISKYTEFMTEVIYVNKRLGHLIDSSSVPTNFFSQTFLAGIKLSWTNENNPYLFRYFHFLLNNTNKDRKPDFDAAPPNITAHENIDFMVSAKRMSEEKDKQNIKVDLKFYANRFFFSFADERYKGWLIFAVVLQNEYMFVKLYEPTYSEEEFRKILQSEIPLSFAIQIPAGITNIRVIAVNPFRQSYGIKSISVEP
jgi:Ca-activated chloride channel homolog